MATYHQIQEYVQRNYGFQPKTCWIADIKDQLGLPVRRAWNRASEDRQVPCPPDKSEAIMETLRHFGMIR